MCGCGRPLWRVIVVKKHITLVRVFKNYWTFCRFSCNIQGHRKCYWRKFLRCVLACSLGSQRCKYLHVCVCVCVCLCAFLKVIALKIAILCIYFGSTLVLLCYAFSALTYKWHHDVKCCVRVCNNWRKMPAHFAKLDTKGHEAGNLLAYRRIGKPNLSGPSCGSSGLLLIHTIKGLILCDLKYCRCYWSTSTNQKCH